MQELRKRDPIATYEALLLANRVIDEAKIESLRREILSETNDATDRAEALPLPNPRNSTSNVYAGDYEPWQ